MTRWLRLVKLLAVTLATLTGELVLFAWQPASNVLTFISVWRSLGGLARSGEWMAAAVLVLVPAAWVGALVGVDLSERTPERRAWWLAVCCAGLGCQVVVFLSPLAFFWVLGDRAPHPFGQLAWQAPILLIAWASLTLVFRQRIDPPPSRMRLRWATLTVACAVLMTALAAAKPSDVVLRRELTRQVQARFPDEALRSVVAARLAARIAQRSGSSVLRSEQGRAFQAAMLRDSSDVRAASDFVQARIVAVIQASPMSRVDLCWGVYLRQRTECLDVAIEGHYRVVRVRERWRCLTSEQSMFGHSAQQRFVSFPEDWLVLIDRTLEEQSPPVPRTQ